MVGGGETQPKGMIEDVQRDEWKSVHVVRTVGSSCGIMEEELAATVSSGTLLPTPSRLYFRSRRLLLRQGSLAALAIPQIPSVPRLPIKGGSPTFESHCITHSQILFVTTFWSMVVSRP